MEYTGNKTDITGWIMAEHGAPRSKWKVVEFDHYQKAKDGKHSREYWLAECCCEKHTRRVIERYGLLLGIYKDCGCSKKCNNLEGKKFGRLTALKNLGIKKLPNRAHGRTVYLCKCDCGREVEIVANDLITGNVISCGCQLHEAQISNGRKRHKTNIYDLSGEYGVGYTLNTGVPFYFDLEDYDKIKDYCWTELIRRPKKEGNKSYHALGTTIYTPNSKKTLLMTSLLGCFRYDHINRNALDNRKSNLRPCESRQNVMNVGLKKNNSSGIIGVYMSKKDKKWHATAKIKEENGKIKAITRQFKTKEEAIRCRLQMEHDYYGEFAPQKHLFAQYGIEDDSQKEKEKDV